MVMARWERTIVDGAGNVIPGVNFEVRKELPGAALAALKSDRAGVSGISNPGVADGNGKVAFHVTGGAYKIRVWLGPSGTPTYEEIWRYVPIGTAQELDAFRDSPAAFAVVRVAATTNVAIATALENGDTVDGVVLATGDFVLLAGQTAPAQNGVYQVQASGAAPRADSFAAYDDHPGRYFSVMEGTAGADKLYRCTSNKGGTLGTTAITISEFSSGGGSSFDYLINGNGQVDQEATSSLTDAVYGHDQWYALTQTAAIAKSSLTDVADGLPNMIRLTQSQASAQRFGYAQVIEAKRIKKLRGREVTFGGKLRYSNAAAVRYAILEWTGTADTVTKDVVSDWTNGTFTAGQFFNSTTLTVRAVGTITPSAATVTDFSLTATLGSSLNNLVLFIWTEGTSAQNSTLDIAASLKIGTSVSPLDFRSYVDELWICQRYWEATNYTFIGDGYATGSFCGVNVYYKNTKRVSPTASFVNNYRSNCGTETIYISNQFSCTMYATATGASTIIEFRGILTANARL